MPNSRHASSKVFTRSVIGRFAAVCVSVSLSSGKRARRTFLTLSSAVFKAAFAFSIFISIIHFI